MTNYIDLVYPKPQIPDLTPLNPKARFFTLDLRFHLQIPLTHIDLVDPKPKPFDLSILKNLFHLKPFLFVFPRLLGWLFVEKVRREIVAEINFAFLSFALLESI